MTGHVDIQESSVDLEGIRDYILKYSRFSWISSVFDSSNIRLMVQGKYVDPISFYIDIFGKSRYSFLDVYNEIYQLMKFYYRNEYVLRNEIINQIYGVYHNISISNTITEFKVGSSRADLAVFNGTSTCYEIKTDIDNLSRLDSQIDDYASLFDLVYIVSSEKKLREIVARTPDYIGIKVIDDECNIKDFRIAESNMDRMDHEIMFQSLRKLEHISISSLYEKIDLDKDPVSIYFQSKKIFCSLSTAEAHKHYMLALAERRTDKSIQVLQALPHSLANAYFSTKMISRHWGIFLQKLSQSEE